MKVATKLVISIIAVVLIALVFTGGFGLQSFVNEPIVIPFYTSAKCVPIESRNMDTISLSTNNNKPVVYNCLSYNKESGNYIPSGKECEFKIENSNVALTTVFVCDRDDLNKIKKTTLSEINSLTIDDVKKAGCEEKTQSFLGSLGQDTIPTIIVPEGSVIYIDTANVLSKIATIQAKYPSYGLEIRLDNNRLNPVTPTCLLSDLTNKEDFHRIDGNSNNIVQIDKPINFITALNRVESSGRVITTQGLNSGEPIYVEEVGYYYPVKRADDGLLYVDINNKKSSNMIECIPNVGGCNAEAKKIKLEEAECQANGIGVMEGWFTTDTPNVYCQMECVDGKNKISKDCVNTQCSDTEVYDFNKKSCVDLTERLTGVESQDFNFYIIAFMIVGAVLIYAILSLFVGKKK